VDARRQATLKNGWIPTEEKMMAFIDNIRKDRTALRRFNLAILIYPDNHSTMFRSDLGECQQIFEFDYVSPDDPESSDDEVWYTPVESVEDLPVNDYETTQAQIQPRRQLNPEIRSVLNHDLIQALYDNMLGKREYFISESEESPSSDDDVFARPRFQLQEEMGR
jgi:hypothetical protein